MLGTVDGPTPLRQPTRLLRFLGVFILAYGVLQGSYLNLMASGAQAYLVDQATVAVAVWGLQQLFGEPVIAEAYRLIAPGFSLSVLHGCEGLETILLLLAVMIAFPAPISRKLIGMVTGALFIYLLNLGRVMALYFTLKLAPAYFALLHGYLAPLFLITAAMLFFVGGISVSTKQASAP